MTQLCYLATLRMRYLVPGTTRPFLSIDLRGTQNGYSRVDISNSQGLGTPIRNGRCDRTLLPQSEKGILRLRFADGLSNMERDAARDPTDGLRWRDMAGMSASYVLHRLLAMLRLWNVEAGSWSVVSIHRPGTMVRPLGDVML